MDPAITSTHLDAVRDAAAFLRTEHGPHGVSQQPGKAASISLYHKDPAYLRALAPRLAEEFARRGYPFRVSMTWLYINCDLEHISKATGLDRLLDHIGCIGDTAGDLPIRDRAAFFACPANASDDIKPRADYISDRPEAQGVVDILTRLVPFTVTTPVTPKDEAWMAEIATVDHKPAASRFIRSLDRDSVERGLREMLPQ
jgi:hydroxymethylpyrimidine pyrophosphatase-like HAD family hydrolase